MQVTISFETNVEDDGVAGTSVFIRDNVDDLYELSSVFADATRGIGFTYVQDVGFLKSGGSEIWGERI